MMLQMEKMSSAVTKRLQAVYRNAMNLRILITELLDFRKQEQGFMKLKVECVDVVPFIKDIYTAFYFSTHVLSRHKCQKANSYILNVTVR